MASDESGVVMEDVDLVEDLKIQLRRAEAACEQYRKELAVLQERLNEALEGQKKFQDPVSIRLKQSQSLEQLKAVSNGEDVKTKLHSGHKDGDNEGSIEQQQLQSNQGYNENVKNESHESLDKDDDKDRTSTTLRKNPQTTLDSQGSQNLRAVLLDKERIIEELSTALDSSRSNRMEAKNTLTQPLQDLRNSVAVAQDTTTKRTGNDEGSTLLTSEAARPQTLMARDEDENTHRLEKEVKTLQEQNTALTLYINRTIARLLQHENFEALFQIGSFEDDQPPNAMKDLENVNPALRASGQSYNTQPPSLLRRAGSIFSGKTRSEANSAQTDEERSGTLTTNPAEAADKILKPPADAILTSRPPTHPNQDPATATSIPLRRADSHRRRPHQTPTSEWRSTPLTYSRRSSSQISPGGTQRVASYFGRAPTAASTTGEVTTPGTQDGPLSFQGSPESVSSEAPGPITPSKRLTSGSTTSADLSAATTTLHSTSPISRSISAASSMSGDPRPAASSSASGSNATGTGTGTVMTSAPNRMRPLRLVQEKQEADDAAAEEKRKVNRSSWMGNWFASGSGGAASTASKADHAAATAATAATASAPTAGSGPARKTSVSVAPQWPGTKGSSPGKGRASGGS